MTEADQAFHVQLTADNRQAWRDKCRRGGYSLAALMDRLSARLDEIITPEIEGEARELTGDRRSRPK